MPRVYFISYARPRLATGEAEDLVKKLHTDLEREVAELLGEGGNHSEVRTLGNSGTFGFYDRCSLEAGTADWERELKQNLASHPIGLILLSPSYLHPERTWCRWECRYLAKRNEALGSGTNPPRTCLILEWVKRVEGSGNPVDFPNRIQHIGDSIAGDRQADIQAVKHVCDMGLREVIGLQHDPNEQVIYTRFVKCLGRYIVEQYQRWQKLDEAKRHYPEPRDYESTSWEPAKQSGARTAALPRAAYPRKVHVVYCAARPEEVPQDRQPHYLQEGEGDWHPFEATDETTGTPPPVAEYIKELEGEPVRWSFRTFASDMERVLEQEIGGRHPLLFVVDPWTACNVDSYREALDRYAHLKGVSQASRPVVILDEANAEHVPLRQQFIERVQGIFGFNGWTWANNPKQLRESLRSVVEDLRNTIRNTMASQRPITGNGPPPISANE